MALTLLKQHINQFLQADLSELRGLKATMFKVGQCSYGVGRDVMLGQTQLYAMSLVYITLQSVVPILALTVSLLKSLGYQDKLAPIMSEFLSPMGAKGEELSQQIFSFIDSINIAVLGGFGILVLLYTATSLFRRVEGALNYIWQHAHQRSMVEQFNHYLKIIVLAPVFLILVTGVVPFIVNSKLVDYLVSLDVINAALWVGIRLLPFLITVGVIAVFFRIIPNAQVKLRAAVAGALVSAFFWKLSGMLFSTFAMSSTRYEVIYSGFAIAILLLIWLFLSWLIFLIGANFSFYWQNPHAVHVSRDQLNISGVEQRQVAFQIMVNVGEKFQEERHGCSMSELVHKLGFSESVLSPLLMRLVENGLLLKGKDKKDEYLPGGDTDTIMLRDIILAVDGSIPPEGRYTAIDNLFRAEAERRDQLFGDQSLRSLLGSNEIK